MPGDTAYWDGLVSADMVRRVLASPSDVVQAQTPLRQLGGISNAVVVDCDDGRRYVLKGRQVMRPLVADQIVGRLAVLVEAPVPQVELVHVPSELISPGSLLEHFHPGIAHGSEYVPGCTDSYYVQYVEESENRERFAALAVLFGWTDAEDRQFLYARETPHLVYSVDHGAFFTGSSDWTIETLNSSMTTSVDHLIAVQAGLGRRVLWSALDRLSAATDRAIAKIVATPPDEWGIALDERVVIAQYLASRRDALVATISTC